MQLVALQYDIVWEDKPANHKKVRALLETVTVEKNTLIVLPEMFNTGFSLNTNVTAEDPTGPSHSFLKELAIEHQSYILASLTAKAPDNTIRNQALVFAPNGTLKTQYNKIHTFTPGGETGPFTPGNDVVTFTINDVTIAPFICYDLRFPEIYRQATHRGAQLLITIANWPAVRSNHWHSLLKARAIENQAYCLGLNRTGKDPIHHYAGQSILFDPLGNPITQAEKNESILQATIDLKPLTDYRKKFPAQKDARPQFLE